MREHTKCFITSERSPSLRLCLLMLCQYAEFKKSEITKASWLRTAGCRSFEHRGVPSICRGHRWWLRRRTGSAPHVLSACGSRTQPPESIRRLPDKPCLTMSKCRDPQSKWSGKHFMARCVHQQERDAAAVFLLHRAVPGARGDTPKSGSR